MSPRHLRRIVCALEIYYNCECDDQQKLIRIEVELCFFYYSRRGIYYFLDEFNAINRLNNNFSFGIRDIRDIHDDADV